MEDKEKIIIDGVDVSQCEFYIYYSSDRYPHRCGMHKDMFGMPACCDVADCCKNCYFKQLARKEQEYEELRQYHNKCCEEFEKEKQALLEKYNQVSINFYNGDYCNTEHCSLLKAKEQECEKYKQTLDEFNYKDDYTLRHFGYG